MHNRGKRRTTLVPRRALAGSGPTRNLPHRDYASMEETMAFEILASGFGLIEGPRADDQNRLYFSDVPNGGVYRRSPDGNIETVIPKRRGVGGIAINQG